MTAEQPKREPEVLLNVKRPPSAAGLLRLYMKQEYISISFQLLVFSLLITAAKLIA
jgi:hypothetical protein